MKIVERFKVDKKGRIRDRGKFIQLSKAMLSSRFRKKYGKKFIKKFKKPRKKVIRFKKYKIKIKKFKKGTVVKGKSYFQVTADVIYKEKRKKEKVKVTSYSHKKKKKRITKKEIDEYLNEAIDLETYFYFKRPRKNIVSIQNIEVIRWVKR